MKISELRLNYLYTRDDGLIYKVIHINHNSQWAVCIRYSTNVNVGDLQIINDNWLNNDINKNFHITYEIEYYNMFGSLVVKENELLEKYTLIQKEN
jgi:hypothetical protein